MVALVDLLRRRTVRSPDGRVWRVGVLVRRGPRWKKHQTDAGYDAATDFLTGFVGDDLIGLLLFPILVVGGAILFLVLGLVLLPVAIFAIELVLVIVLSVLFLLPRVVGRSPWTLYARELRLNDDSRYFAWRIRGTEQTLAARARLVAALERGEEDLPSLELEQPAPGIR